jgi:hypothetical protein
MALMKNNIFYIKNKRVNMHLHCYMHINYLNWKIFCCKNLLGERTKKVILGEE